MDKSKRRAAKVLVDMLRGKRRPSRRALIAAHADLVGVSMANAVMPTARQLDVLMRMEEYEVKFGQPPKMMDMAEEMGVKPPALSEACRFLLGMGLIERLVPGRPMPRNLKVSAKGRRFLAENRLRSRTADANPEEKP